MILTKALCDRLFFCCILIFFSLNAFAQGSVDVKYVAIKSVKKSLIYDLDSSYNELDKKKLVLENNIREIDNEISNLDQQVIGIDAIKTALEDKKWSLEREIIKLNRAVRRLDRYWNEQDKKKNRIERIVIDKSIIDGIWIKID